MGGGGEETNFLFQGEAILGLKLWLISFIKRKKHFHKIVPFCQRFSRKSAWQRGPGLDWEMLKCWSNPIQCTVIEEGQKKRQRSSLLFGGRID